MSEWEWGVSQTGIQQHRDGKEPVFHFRLEADGYRSACGVDLYPSGNVEGDGDVLKKCKRCLSAKRKALGL
jgi:hypothetical protein